MRLFRGPRFGGTGGGGGGGAVASVFGRVGVVTAVLGDYVASLIGNDSTVPGATVKNALETLAASILPDAVTSVFGRVGAIAAALNDYAASLIQNDSSVAGATVKDALENLNAGSVNCTSNGVFGLGLYSCAENSTTQASGATSVALGSGSIAGLQQRIFTIPAGGTLVTVVGNMLGQFNLGKVVRIRPTVPAAGLTVSGTIASAPIFAAGNTTFNLAAPIDGVTTGGRIVESDTAIGARGAQAHAEGDRTVAQGYCSHAEGGSSKTFGSGAHAEGAATKAYGHEAHSEGETTIAGGIDSHAEGGSTVAMGFCSHAEGGGGATAGPISSGGSSHAEGLTSRTGNLVQAFTIAAGGITVTIPGNVVAEFINGHRIPFVVTAPFEMNIIYGTIATQPVFAAGNTTFDLTTPFDPAEGGAEIVFATGGLTVDDRVGIGAHSEGNGTIANELCSHAEGQFCIATGAEAHAEGNTTTAAGQGSHAEGQLTIARSLNSHAEGTQTVATGQSSHAEGVLTRAGNPIRTFTTAAGGTVVTIAGNVTTEFVNGQDVKIDPTTPVITPRVTRTVISVPAFAAGNTTFNISAAIDPYTTSGTIVDNLAGDTSHAEGRDTVASGKYSHAENQLTLASGLGSHAEGGSTIASATYSHAEGNTTLASGLNSHAEGNNTQATNSFAHAEGQLCVASGSNGSHAEGFTTIASGVSSHAQGLTCVAAGTGSHAMGTDGKAYNDNESALGNNKFAAVGDNQRREVVVKGLTPGVAIAEAVNLVAGALAGNFLQNSTSYLVTIRAIATKTGLGAAVRQSGSFFFCFVVDVTAGGVLAISAVTVLAPPILNGAAFVGATLVPVILGIRSMGLTFTIGAGLTIASRVAAHVEYVEVLGT